MKPLRFEGRSDDTFGEYGRFSVDHDNCANGKPIVFAVRAPSGEGMNVYGEYCGDGWPHDAPACWVIGIQQTGEDRPLPAWPMRWGIAENGYSPSLQIEAPDDVTVQHLPFRPA